MTGPVTPPPASSAAPGEPVDLTSRPPDGTPQLRADAARNRSRLLDAASRLLTEHGPERLTMDAVACAAGVGKGTVFRRFGDRSGLLFALLDHSEQTFQGSFLSGPPPLGPGAPAVDRLHAFGPALIRHESDHHELILATRKDPLRTYSVPPYRLRLTHVVMLLREAGAAPDPEFLAHTLLAATDTALVHHLTTAGDRSSYERLECGWHDLVTRFTRPVEPPYAGNGPRAAQSGGGGPADRR
ncbi:Transcriptional regulator, TetR family [Streptomyces sp. YIM 130001]|uniref:TetR/AcrR family transcriptional regulator n=1 Tax=Streptomyces sp. YIM 130001 TaxID=2259644 RepID=UPI000E65386B|nr:TetR/AcrR family transcriptional regulator [Streptomyces sp. YIM 130001]RII14718.1 Transcriptional regulator, TetR family [Streptomyces sp. YIM 130001]